MRSEFLLLISLELKPFAAGCSTPHKCLDSRELEFCTNPSVRCRTGKYRLTNCCSDRATPYGLVVQLKSLGESIGRWFDPGGSGQTRHSFLLFFALSIPSYPKTSPGGSIQKGGKALVRGGLKFEGNQYSNSQGAERGSSFLWAACVEPNCPMPTPPPSSAHCVAVHLGTRSTKPGFSAVLGWHHLHCRLE